MSYVTATFTSILVNKLQNSLLHLQGKLVKQKICQPLFAFLCLFFFFAYKETSTRNFFDGKISNCLGFDGLVGGVGWLT